MGYQESFRPIEHLAESAGIKQAIEDYKDDPHIPEYCSYCCTTRSKKDGQLYACICGQRYRVHMVGWIDLEYCIPSVEEYADYYEDLDEALVEEAAKEHPELVEKAYQEVARSFEQAAEREREWKRQLREEACELWPSIADLLQRYGPSPACFFSHFPLFEGHNMFNILADLERQGLIASDGVFLGDNLWFTDKAKEMLGIEAIPPSMGLDERLVRLLDECGAMSSRVLSGMLGVGVEHVRTILRKLIEEERVVPLGRGRARKYQIA